MHPQRRDQGSIQSQTPAGRGFPQSQQQDGESTNADQNRHPLRDYDPEVEEDRRRKYDIEYLFMLFHS